MRHILGNMDLEREKPAEGGVCRKRRKIAGQLLVVAVIDIEHIRQDAVFPPESANQLVQVAQHGFAP